MNRSFFTRALLVATVALATSGIARAVVIVDGPQNTSAPPGDQGWQYVGTLNGGGGVLVAPQVVLSAAHLLPVADSTTFFYNGQNYLIDSVENVGDSDMVLLHLATSTSHAGASLFNGAAGDASSAPVTVIGFGGPKGSALTHGAATYGWAFSSPTSTPSWGNNTIDQIATSGPLPFAAFSFTSVSGSSMYTAGDSGGGMFTFHDGQWQLLGINDGVDGYWSQTQATSTDPNHPPAPAIVAAIFDLDAANVGADPANQLYTIFTDNITHQNSYVLADSSNPMQGYASFISSDSAFTVGSTGDTYTQYLTGRIAALGVPEPATLSLALLAVPALLLRRRPQ